MSSGIKHIEELTSTEFINIFNDFDNCVVTEKIDGSQLLFGIDENGFYTSRETKGGRRVYNINEYTREFSNSYKRSAHLALQNILPILQLAGFCIGDQLEVEVLYGKIPNVIQYSSEINSIIFLKSTEGNFNIDKLECLLNNIITTVSLIVPYTENGKSIQYKSVVDNWKFSLVPKLDIKNLNINKYYKSINQFLNKKSNIKNLSNKEILITPLNKKPVWSNEWKIDKELIRIERDLLHLEFVSKLNVLKYYIIDNVIKNSQSKLCSDSGCIEGIVIYNKNSKSITKIVDKARFLIIKDFLWEVRNSITDRRKNSKSFMVRLHNELLDVINSEKSFEFLKKECSKIIDNYDVILNNELEKFNENKNKFIIVDDKTYFYHFVEERTKEIFVKAFYKIANLKCIINESTSIEEIIYATDYKTR